MAEPPTTGTTGTTGTTSSSGAPAGSAAALTKPSLIPMTVDLGRRRPYNATSQTDHLSVTLDGPSDPKSAVNVMHVLNAHKAVYEQFTKTQADKLARATQGDAEHIYRQLDAMNDLFKDGDRRSHDPRVFVFNCVVPVREGFWLVHRCLWDIYTPLAMLPVYCQEVCGDLGLGVGVAGGLKAKLEEHANALRKEVRGKDGQNGKVPEGFVEVDPAAMTGSGVLRESPVKFPVVLKGTAEEAAALEGKMKALAFGDDAGLQGLLS